MKKLPTIFCSIALLAATATPSLAAVNCGLINKDLDRGRKPEDIAERMGVSVNDVQHCKVAGDKAVIGAMPAPTNTAPKGVKPPATPPDPAAR